MNAGIGKNDHQNLIPIVSDSTQLQQLIDDGFDWAPGHRHSGAHPRSYYQRLLDVLQEVPTDGTADDFREALDQLFEEISDPENPLRVRSE